MRHRHRDVPVRRARDAAEREGHLPPGCRLSRRTGEAAFIGFPPASLDFFRGLAANNEKPWFEAHRPAYEAEVKAPCAALVLAVANALRAADLPLEGEPRRSGFRIHRDTRFSRDKRPFKTNAGLVWYRQGGGKDGAGILYFHLAPGGCFAAAAFYLPTPDQLSSIREAIRVHPDRWRDTLAALAARGLSLAPADTLSRMPRGFEDMAASPDAPSLKLKSYLVRRPIPLDRAATPALVDDIVTLAADALPLLRFGWSAIDEGRA